MKHHPEVLSNGIQLGTTQLYQCWTAVGTSWTPAQASWDLWTITWLATSLAELTSKVFTLRGAKRGISDSVGLSPARPNDAKEALSPIPSTDCARCCHPAKSWSLGDSNFLAQTWNSTGLRPANTVFGEGTDFHSTVVAARVVVGLNQDKTEAGCAGSTGAEQAEQEGLRAQELGGGGAVSPKLWFFFCYSVLWVHCFISVNKAAMKLKGSDSESKLFSVKENNQTWTGGSGTAGRRRRWVLQKQKWYQPERTQPLKWPR